MDNSQTSENPPQGDKGGSANPDQPDRDPVGGYYYDDTTGYEVYEGVEDDTDEDDGRQTEKDPAK